MKEKIEYLKYIRHSEVEDYIALGWKIKSLDSHHSDYSVLGVWPYEGEPVIP